MSRPFTVPKNAPPLMREIMSEIMSQRTNPRRVCRAAGIAETNFMNWKTNSPRFPLFEKAANVLGLELVLVRRDPGPAVEEPARARCPGRKATIPANAFPLLRSLFEEAHRQNRGVTRICEDAGIFRNSFRNWSRHSPSLYSFEAAANTLGMDLKLVRRKERSS